MDATTLATLLHTTTDSELADAILNCTHLDELLEACTRINDDPDDISHTLTETADALPSKASPTTATLT
ncbi:hypothetical protein [Saccharopolyspora gloriosae]|uniref:hypothetical protein n=1 Tax=Saccharopolyspora gloriosae TaxID=455344 RepID=UPI001FB79BB6|nr:hypothetical protein [Saccharopolyspora gloriosae]